MKFVSRTTPYPPLHAGARPKQRDPFYLVIEMTTFSLLLESFTVASVLLLTLTQLSSNFKRSLRL